MPPKTIERPVPEAKPADAARVSPSRQRELDAAISTITKAYGEGSIMRLGDARAQTKIAVIPTGALALDLALGVGGKGRRSEPVPVYQSTATLLRQLIKGGNVASSTPPQ